MQELTGSKTSEPLSRDEFLTSLREMYSDRVNRLKQLFAVNPAEAVPELQYLTDHDWLEWLNTTTTKSTRKWPTAGP